MISTFYKIEKRVYLTSKPQGGWNYAYLKYEQNELHRTGVQKSGELKVENKNSFNSRLTSNRIAARAITD